MKQNYFYLGILLTLLCWNTTKAQIENYYTFSESTASYAPLVGADETVLSRNTFSSLSIPFDFEYAGQKIDRLIFKNNGEVSLGGTSEPQPNELSDLGQQNESGTTAIIAPLWDNQMTVANDNTIAKRKTLLSGTAPFRTFTIEWEKVLWTSQFPSNTSSEVSFRIIFEETTNNITFLYGPNNSTENQSTSIGLNTEFSDQISFISVTPGSPSSVSSTVSDDNISTSEYPGEGTQYTFTYQFPNCRIPSNLDIDTNSLTPSTVDVSWTNAGSETSWDILVINRDNSSREVISANSNPFTLTNLDQDTNYSIAIRSNCTTSDSDYSPQVFFTTLETCPSPININSTDITLDSADFSWQAGDSETSWEATVVLFNDPEPVSGDVITSTTYSVNGLIKDTDYTLYVRSNCDTDGFSKWITYDFRTIATCQIPTSLTITNETCSSGTIGWTSNGSETSWEVSVTRIGTSDEVIYAANTNPFTLNDLNPNTTYRIFVRAVCASDDKSRYSSRDFISTTEDTTDPTPVAQDITVQLGTNGFIVLDPTAIDNGSTDDCAIDSITVSPSVLTCSDLGANTVTMTVTDIAGNSDSTTALVTVEDNTNPVAQAKDITVALDENGSVSITGNDINDGSSDNCNLSLTVTPNTFDCSNVGENTVTLTATDTSNNFSEMTAIVTVQDVINPTVVTKNISVSLDNSGMASIVASDINDGSSDNCSISSITVSPDTFNCTNVGENTVTLTVTDVNGNSDSNTAVVTVQDTIDPIAQANDITVQLDDNGTITITATDINNGSADDCTIDSITVSPNSFDCSNIGDNTVTLTVTDTSGNSDMTLATVTVIDEMLPTANCIAPFSIQLDDSGLANISAQDINENSSDNCGIQNIAIDKTNFTSADIGEQIVTLTVTDIAGNINTCSTTVTVEGPAFVIEDYVTGLNSPRGLAFDGDQNLFIAEHTTGKIFKATDIETTTEFASTGFNNNGISFDQNNNLYVAESFLSQVLTFDTNAQQSQFLSSSDGISSPWDVKFDTAGNLYVSNFSGNILKITPAGSVSEYTTGLFSPEGIAFDRSGNLFVADRNDRKLIKISPDGSSTTLLTGIVGIRSVAVDSNDFVYFDEQVGNGPSATVKIVKYNQNDGSTTDIIGGLDDSNYLLFNRNGDLFISQSNKVSVVREVGESEILSVEEVVLNTIVFYPNPVINTVSFTTAPSGIRLYDVSGKAIFKSTNSQLEYDLSDLPSGFYLMEITDFSGKRIIQKVNKI
ncbi:fibronectin type III domain-containing protein [uncultured Aquimarina sp.]|uniref:fibronectin type III domain-containing protein n=1 Tax=uncultured Aquimarina sp. TaxID=575652 RepID=UPI00262D0B77|nr:fibronectin type III domain-containing protein [uncultured Aquimarina sp.]